MALIMIEVNSWKLRLKWLKLLLCTKQTYHKTNKHQTSKYPFEGHRIMCTKIFSNDPVRKPSGNLIINLILASLKLVGNSEKEQMFSIRLNFPEG